MPYPSPKGQLTMLYVSQFRRIVLNNGKSQSKKLNSKLKTRMSEKYSKKQQIIAIQNALLSTYSDKTMATASLRTLSPKTRAYRSTSTWRSWNMARAVTEITTCIYL